MAISFEKETEPITGMTECWLVVSTEEAEAGYDKVLHSWSVSKECWVAARGQYIQSPLCLQWASLWLALKLPVSSVVSGTSDFDVFPNPLYPHDCVGAIVHLSIYTLAILHISS